MALIPPRASHLRHSAWPCVSSLSDAEDAPAASPVFILFLGCSSPLLASSSCDCAQAQWYVTSPWMS